MTRAAFKLNATLDHRPLAIDLVSTLIGHAELGADEMTLTLIDTGQAVDFNGVNPPDLDSMPERGMGVYMIHALVDEVVYRGGAPNVLSLTKRTASSINEGQTRDELHPYG
jgi:hypothetical protein